MVESSYFRRGKPFADLFCGSGTLPIEAAMYALNIAPNARRGFDFTKWKCAAAGALERARQEAEDVRFRGEIPPLFAGDISARAVDVAKFHAARAGVERYIRFSCADMREFTAPERYGVLVSNPPYGERLGREDDLFSLYRDFARTFRRLNDWSCYFLSAFEGAERAFGRCPKKRRLWNARIPCTLYAYEGAKPPKERET